MFYVPVRNQGLIRSSLPTSHGFVPRGGEERFNPLPPSGKSVFVNGHEFVGTVDSSPYLCVVDGLKWREEVLGGEERVREALTALAREGGKKVAEILGTEVLDNESGSMSRCSMINVALPLVVQGGEGQGEEGKATAIPESDKAAATNWMLQRLVNEHKTFVALYVYRGRWWARLSAQVYLELEDFEWAGQVLKEVCERVAKGEYKQ